MDYALQNAWTKPQVVSTGAELSLEEYLKLESELIHHSGIDRDEWMEMFSVLLRQVIDEDATLTEQFHMQGSVDLLVKEMEKRLAKKRSEQIELGLIR